MNLQQLEIDFLPLWILLQRILQYFLGLRVAAISEIDLRFGDRIDFVGIDVAKALAAEIAGERIVAGVHHTTAGRAENRIRLDVGAGNNAVFELGGLAPARGDDGRDAAEHDQRTAPNDPGWRIAEQVVDERSLRRFLG